MAVYKLSKSVDFDGIETQKTIDVSAEMADARDGVYTLYDLDFAPIEGAVQPIGATTLVLTVSPAPTAGTYHLVGIA